MTRILTPDELEEARKKALQPLRDNLYTIGVFGWLISPVVQLLLILTEPLGIWYGKQNKRIKEDMKAGTAETVAGVVERTWTGWFFSFKYAQVAGKVLRISKSAFIALNAGDRVTVEYLPQSKVALSVKDSNGKILHTGNDDDNFYYRT